MFGRIGIRTAARTGSGFAPGRSEPVATSVEAENWAKTRGPFVITERARAGV
jgi:hypothetical protein